RPAGAAGPPARELAAASTAHHVRNHRAARQSRRRNCRDPGVLSLLSRLYRRAVATDARAHQRAQCLAMKSPDLIAVIPAAGQGSRLGTTLPKFFVEIKDGLRICDILLARVAAVTRDVHLVLSPEGHDHFEGLGRPAPPGVRVTCSVQQQPREGEECPPRGRSDVGTFAVSTEGLDAAWQRYLSEPESRGARTGEINLLPFFAHLARREGFAVQIVEVGDAAEARGVNTHED